MSFELLTILRCPVCIRDTEGLLDIKDDSLLICRDCGSRYPIVENIPVFIVESADNCSDNE